MKPVYTTEPRTALVRPGEVRVAIHEVKKAGIGYTIDRTIFGHSGEGDRTETVGWRYRRKKAVERADCMQDEMFYKRLREISMQEEAQAAENVDINPGAFVGGAIGATYGFILTLPADGLHWALQYFVGIPLSAFYGAHLGMKVDERRNSTEPVYQTQERFNGVHTVSVDPIGYTVNRAISGQTEVLGWNLFKDTAIARADEMQEFYDDIQTGKKTPRSSKASLGLPEAVLAGFLAFGYVVDLKADLMSYKNAAEAATQLSRDAINLNKDAVNLNKKLSETASGLYDENAKLSDENRRLRNSYGSLTTIYLPNSPEEPAVFFDNTKLVPLRMSCESDSMAPTLGCRDVVLAYPRPRPGEIKVGDVVSYKVDEACSQDFKRVWEQSVPAGEHILHRVVGTVESHKTEVRKDGKAAEKVELAYRMKGDKNQEADPCLVTHEMIRAKVAGIVKGKVGK